MSSSNPVTGKSVAASSAHPPAPSAGPPPPALDSTRRPSQVASSTNQQPTPRKGQPFRKQHRNQRRPSARSASRSSAYLEDDDDAMADLRNVRIPSGRRRGQTSITHLLNYASPHPSLSQMDRPRPHRRNPTWGPGSGYHAVDKARYVHANYRFVVAPGHSYAKHAADADLFLDWSDVLQIIASAESQSASCPICLSPPVAPRMTRCGHIFCLACLIRFMDPASGADEEATRSNRGARFKKCPLCEDGIRLQDLRPVRFFAGQEGPLPRAGHDVVLRLMTRHVDSTLALPRDGAADVLGSTDDVPWHFAADVLDYARIMKGTADYMLSHFDDETSALLRQQDEDSLLFGLDNEWTQRAIKAIRSAKERIQDIDDGRSDSSAWSPLKQPSLSTDSTPSDTAFFFYSAQPHLYLSPLDIRILKTKYGTFSSFPSTLLPRLEHISTGHVVDDSMRKRAKYLGHLPQGCVISFLECDWTDIVPADILETFSTEIERRRKRNREKAAQEERERMQSERLEAAALRGSMGTRLVPGRPAATSAAIATAARVVEEEEEEEEEDATTQIQLSDFQPLSAPTGVTPPDPRPGFATLASLSTSPSTQRTVWGTRAVAASPVAGPSRPTVDVDDGWLKEEEFLDTSELAMQLEALEAAGIGGDGSGGNETPQSSTTMKQKKKKKQKITLMSTGGRRGQ